MIVVSLKIISSDWTIVERRTNGERKGNALWTHGERFVKGKSELSLAESASDRKVKTVVNT